MRHDVAQPVERGDVGRTVGNSLKRTPAARERIRDDSRGQRNDGTHQTHKRQREQTERNSAFITSEIGHQPAQILIAELLGDFFFCSGDCVAGTAAFIVA